MAETEDTDALVHLSEAFLRNLKSTTTYRDRVEYLTPILSPAIEQNYLSLVLNTNDLCNGIFKNESSSIGLRKEGNDFYEKRRYKEAHTFYTLSIATAPATSNSLALAFANRSAALKSMEKLDECLSDIERALSHGYPKSLRVKLWLRKAQCYRQLGKIEEAEKCFRAAENSVENSELSEANKKSLRDTVEAERHSDSAVHLKLKDHACKKTVLKIPAISYGLNKETQNASDALAFNKESHSLVSTRDIKPGDVLIVENPLMSVLESTMRWRNCDHCACHCDALIPCTSCDWAMYCSVKCRAAAAAEYHQTECVVVCRYCRMLGAPCRQETLLLVRLVCMVGVDHLLAAFTSQPSHRDTRDSHRYLKYILNLKSHFQHRPVKESIQDCVDVLNIIKCFQLSENINEKVFAEVLLEIYNIVYSNVEAIQLRSEEIMADDSVSLLSYVGHGVYTTSTLMSHSCDPNTFATYHGRTRVVRAARSIIEGAQVTHAYTKTFDQSTKLERQRELKSRFNMDCTCQACSHDWPVIDLLPTNPVFTEEQHRRAIQESEKRLTHDASLLLSHSQVSLVEQHLELMNKLGYRLNQSYLRLQDRLLNYYRL